MQCLLTCNGDIDKAAKLYEFMIKDMEDLPLFDAPVPTRMQQVKETIGQGMGWLKENKDDIMQGIEFVRGLLGKGGSAAPSGDPLPPIN